MEHSPLAPSPPLISLGTLLRCATDGSGHALWQQHIVPALRQRNMAESTLLVYRKVFEHLLLVCSQKGAEPQDPSQLLNRYEQWMTEKPYHKETVRKRLSTANVLLRLLVGHSQRTTRTRTRHHMAVQRLSTRPYTDGEVSRLLAAATPDETVIVLLALEAALTVTEIGALKWADVHLKSGKDSFLRLPMTRKAPPNLEETLDQAPSERPRYCEIPLSLSLEEALKNWRSQSGKVGKEQPVTVRTSQTHLSGKFRGLCQRAGVPVLGLRGLRVTAGARAFNENNKLWAVRFALRLNSQQQMQEYAWVGEYLKLLNAEEAEEISTSD